MDHIDGEDTPPPASSFVPTMLFTPDDIPLLRTLLEVADFFIVLGNLKDLPFAGTLPTDPDGLLIDLQLQLVRFLGKHEAVWRGLLRRSRACLGRTHRCLRCSTARRHRSTARSLTAATLSDCERSFADGQPRLRCPPPPPQRRRRAVRPRQRLARPTQMRPSTRILRQQFCAGRTRSSTF